MIKAFKYRIYPTKYQETRIDLTIELCRQLYNTSLQQRQEAYKNKKKSISMYDQIKELPSLKEEIPEYKEVYAQVLQNVISRLDSTFKGFFRRIKTGQTPGYPRYKGKNRYHSITYPQVTSAFRITGNYINIPNIGRVRYVNHRPLEGTPKTVTISKKNNKYFMSISCDDIPERKVPYASNAIGIDPGIKTFLSLSDGSTIDNPRFMKEEQKTYTRLQRRRSKHQKGSKEYKKYTKRIRRLFERVDNKKTNFMFQTARKLVDSHKTICMEDLQVSEIVGDKKAINKKLQDISIGRFKEILKNKVEETGSQRNLVLIDPRNTTKTCSSCGNLKEMPLTTRIYKCSNCGLVLGRDHNAAKNILRLGTQSQMIIKSSRSHHL